MAKKFVRNITNTRCKGRNQEPLETNRQNDILSDEHDVYIRNKNYYHCLTNAIQKIESKNDSIIVSKKDKNTVELEFVGGNGGGGTEPGRPIEIESLSKYIDVNKLSDTHYQLSTGQLEIELEEIRKLIEEMGNGEENDFLGDFNEYDFKAINTNNEIVEKEIPAGGRLVVDLNNSIGKYKTSLAKNHVNYLAINLNVEETYKTAKQNLFVDIINNKSESVALHLGTGYPVRPRHENDIEYSNGDISLNSMSVTNLQFTFYTNPVGEIIRIYVKDITK